MNSTTMSNLERFEQQLARDRQRKEEKKNKKPTTRNLPPQYAPMLKPRVDTSLIDRPPPTPPPGFQPNTVLQPRQKVYNVPITQELLNFMKKKRNPRKLPLYRPIPLGDFIPTEYGERTLVYPTYSGEPLSPYYIDITKSDTILIPAIYSKWGYLNYRLGIRATANYEYYGELPLSRAMELLKYYGGPYSFSDVEVFSYILDVPAAYYRGKVQNPFDAMWANKANNLAFYTPESVNDVYSWYKSNVLRYTPGFNEWNMVVQFSTCHTWDEDQTFYMHDERRYVMYNPESIIKGQVSRPEDKDKIEVEEFGSDMAYYADLFTHNVVVYFTKRAPHTKKKRQGSFFPYVLDMSLPKADTYGEFCRMVQIYSSIDDLEVSKVCCLEYAINQRLLELNKPLIKIDRRHIVEGSVRTISLKEIADEIGVTIRLRRCRHAEDIQSTCKGAEPDYGDSPIVVDLLLVMDHYMVYKTGIKIGGQSKSTRTWLALLLQENLVRPMTQYELLLTSPKLVDGDSIFKLDTSCEEMCKRCIQDIDESESVTTLDLLEQSKLMEAMNDKDAKKNGTKFYNKYTSRFPFKRKPYYIVFFDTETTKRLNVIFPFLMCYKTYTVTPGEGLDMRYDFVEDHYCFHNSPGLYLQKYIMNLNPRADGDDPSNAEVNVMLVAHNLGFDMASLWSVFGKYDSCLGTRKKPKQVTYKRIIDGRKHTYVFQDSCQLIQGKLESFPERFNLKGPLVDSKLEFPYEYFTDEVCTNIISGKVCVPYSDFDAYYTTPETKKEFDKAILLTDALVTLKQCPNNLKLKVSRGEVYVNIFNLALGYCKSDVEILSEGYIKFMEELRASMNICAEKYFTTASWAYNYLVQHGGVKDCVKIKGDLRLYITGSVYGGRTMTRENKAWHLIVDVPGQGWVYFDGVSLYPSAMIRMIGVPKGAPSVMTDDYEEIKKHLNDLFYVCTINVTDSPGPLPFPILLRREKGGITYDNEQRGLMVLNNYDIEVMKLFGFEEGVHYKTVYGVFWNEISFGLGECIYDLFSKRADLKNFSSRKPDGSDYTTEERKQEAILKLAMNSCYGKMIQRFFETKSEYHIFIENEDLQDGYEDLAKLIDKLAEKYGDDIREVTTIHDGLVPRLSKRGDIYTRKELHLGVRKQIGGEEASNRCHVGSLILSMARLIMAEVFWCVYKIENEDKKKYVFYTDTDSMLIDESIIERLKVVYKEKFGRDLEGKDVGQFHSDFEPPCLCKAKCKNKEGKEEGCNVIDKTYMPRAVESYIIGKKFYCHLVEFRTKGGEMRTYHHTRMKGVPKSITKKLTIADFKEFYEGKSREFDLLEGGKNFKPMFHPKTNEMVNLTHFTREVRRLIPRDGYEAVDKLALEYQEFEKKLEKKRKME